MKTLYIMPDTISKMTKLSPVREEAALRAILPDSYQIESYDFEKDFKVFG